MQIYVDASPERYGAILLGEAKIIAMFNCGSIKQYEYSRTSEVEGLVRTLRAFKPFILEQKFTSYSNNTSVLRVLHSQTAHAPVFCKLEEIMHWYPDIQFVEGKANVIADWLSRHPMVQLPKEASSPMKVSCETSAMDFDSDEHLSLVEGFLKTGTLPSQLNMDDRVAV